MHTAYFSELLISHHRGYSQLFCKSKNNNKKVAKKIYELSNNIIIIKKKLGYVSSFKYILENCTWAYIYINTHISKVKPLTTRISLNNKNYLITEFLNILLR